MLNTVTATVATAAGESVVGAIVARSATFAERRAAGFFQGPPDSMTVDDDEAVDLRLQRWKQQSPRGNEAFFAHRLAWDELDEASARLLLGTPSSTAGPLPVWAAMLREVLRRNGDDRRSALETPRWAQPEKPIPFEQVFLPFVTAASKRLEDEAAEALEALAEGARADFERSLAATLSWAAEKTLYADYLGWRAMPDLQPGRDPARPVYSSYVLSLRGRGLEELLLGYPVLARMLGEIACQWIAAVASFARDVEADRPRLAAELLGGRNPGRVAGLTLGISDRHNGGRTVMQVRFEHGLECFYKPRDCRPEQALNRLLDWLAERDATHRLLTYKVLDCSGVQGDHGWVEKVRAAPSEGREAAARLFKRCGMLTAVLYALEASDCNFENIVVAGEHPVLIDAETLMQPRPHIDEADSWKALAAATEQMFYDSVLRLHILPRWTARPHGEKIDVSGLGAGGGKRGTQRRKAWDRVNRDEMAMRWETVALDSSPYVQATVEGQPVAAQDYLAEVLDGFASMYRMLIERREELWSSDGPMQAFLTLRPRIVPRNTRTYSGVLDRLLDPKSLRDGADASIALDLLAHLFSNAEERPLQWPIVADEMAALLSGNIPKFHADAARRDLEMETGVVADYFKESAAVLLRRRFFAMSPADLDLQQRYIRSSFGYFEDVSIQSEPIAAATDDPVQSDDFAAEAVRLARLICSQAVRAENGSLSWITQIDNPDAQFRQVQPIGLFFYDGIAGIALFLAALQATCKVDEFEEVTESTLRTILDLGSTHMRYHLDREAIGGGLGTASLAYCLARIADLRQDAALLDSALEMAKRIHPAAIAADRRLDTIGGAAGCLLVLRALHGISPQPWLRDLALACGDHLLAARGTSPHGIPAWQTIRGNYLAGFSHGAAGIGCSLAQLYQWTSDGRFREGAEQALAYERTLFNPDEKNWPNLLLPRKQGGYEHWNSWCHGAPGIGLSRLTFVDSMPTPEAREDLDRAIEKAGQRELSNLDSVCCGNLGRIDLLLEAAQRIDQPAHLERAREIAGAVVQRARRSGGYAAGIKDGICVPSFHQGLAGIGYQLLRLARPGTLPSVLGWA